MKKVLIQYFWIFLIGFIILTVMVLTLPEKKDRLKYIEQEISKIKEQRKILTQKEKELEQLSIEKDWKEVDKDTTK
jgi:hypothetical protein